MQYPPAREEDLKENIHGVGVADPYRWMENERDPRLAGWIKAENKLTRQYLDKIPARKKILKRIKELQKVDTIDVPSPRQGLYFTMERKVGQDLGVFYVRKGLHGKKRALIDQNKLSPDKTATVRMIRIARDGSRLAYRVSRMSNDQGSVRVLDVKTGKMMRDSIPEDVYPAFYGGVVWEPDGSGFWYSRLANGAPKGTPKLNHKIYYHRLGDDNRRDRMAFGDRIGRDDIPSISVSDDGRYLIASRTITTGKTESNDLYMQDRQGRSKRWRPVVEGYGAQFIKLPHRDKLYILTNHKAPNWKLMEVPFREVLRGMRAWRPVIPAGRYPIQEVKIIRDRIFVETLENVHSVLEIYDLDGHFLKRIALPTLGSLSGMAGEPEGEEMFFGFTSFVTRFRVYRFDLKTGETGLFDAVRQNVDPERFVIKQVWCRSKDGTKIPLFLVHKKGLGRDGKSPTLLYGYGGFGISTTPSFNPTRLPFLEHGGIYAVANIRGGGEFGEKWHLAGTKGKKQNVFDDFTAAAQWLVRNKYTNPKKLAALGGSNGGLMMGAMVTQRPELFRAVVPMAPVMDMLRFHKFHSGIHWIADYGDPDKPRDSKYLLKYSPYHNLKERDYPATLVLTAEGDDRVHPMHAYKFTARLQKLNRSTNPILLRVESKAGHGGAASVSNSADQYADVYAFVFDRLGMR